MDISNEKLKEESSFNEIDTNYVLNTSDKCFFFPFTMPLGARTHWQNYMFKNLFAKSRESVYGKGKLKIRVNNVRLNIN